jgi:diguanylate cyclase (GGDEF)-like protein
MQMVASLGVTVVVCILLGGVLFSVRVREVRGSAHAVATLGAEVRLGLEMMGAVVGLLLFLGARINRQVVGPLRALDTAVQQSARSMVPAPVAVSGPREVANLAAEFNAMVAARTEFEERIVHQALHDDLTGLPNRSLLQDRLGLALAKTARSGRYVGLLFVDLDRFKVVNDALGHEAGDSVLVDVADRLSQTLRRGDTVARLGGDQFVVLCENLLSRQQAEAIAQRLMKALKLPFRTESGAIVLSASIGVAIGTDAKSDAVGLLRDADAAMYKAKEAGRARFVVFTQALRDLATERLELENDLRQAEARGELHMAFQPIVDIKTEQVRSVEALMRWDHRTRGAISPATFIPVAEEAGIIDDLGDFALREACFEAVRWRDAGHPLPVAVNISARQLTERDLPGRVRATLEGTGLEPELLKLEVTESAIVNNAGAVMRVLRELKELGVSLSIDDFGTGYSSLSYLGQLPVDELKIDQSFVADVATQETGRAVVSAIVEMAKAHGLAVVAEGVEQRAQADALRSIGCQLAQGYLFARPQSPSALGTLLAKGARPRPRPRRKRAPVAV